MNDSVRILVVDDDPDILIGTARLLEKAGYTVDRASSGEDALQAVQIHRPDLLLLDHDMPGINGLEVCCRIKRDPTLADTLVVIVSASHAESDHQAEGLESGADGYIGRPIANRELLARVESYVRILRLTDSLSRHAEELKNSNDAMRQAHLASLNLMEDAVAARDRAEQAYEALRVNEVKYRALIEHSTSGVVIHGPDTAILFSNAMATSLLGLSEDQMRGKRDIDPNWTFLREDGLPMRIEAFPVNRAFALPDGFRGQVVGVSRPDRTEPVWVTCGAYTVRDEKGQILEVVVTLTDITTLKRAEAEKADLEAVNRQLQKSESLGRMAGAIAHRFNNWLHVVAGNLEMAMDGLSGSKDVRDHLTEALSATHSASEVTALMLTYLGQSVTTRAPLDLAQVCRQGVPLLEAAMPMDVRLTSEWPSPGPIVRVNATQVRQVLSNLVTNAWEAMGSAGGAIHVTVTSVAPEDISLSRRFPVDWQPEAQAYACLAVADTGCGIAETDIDKLFEPFFSSKFVGRGMGLPAVLGIVRSDDGAVTVESEPGRGSTFRVYVPLTADPAPLAAHISRLPTHVDSAPDVHGGGTALVVDDEDMVRNVAAAMLADQGFTVLKAKDGVEAVEMARQHMETIRFVLCDLTMPRMNGWQTVTALRRLAPGMPVILASGYSEAQVMEGEHSERPQAYLTKPYGREELRQVLRQILVDDKPP